MPSLHTLLWHRTCRQRRSNPQPADRVAVRRANAANRAPAARLRTNRAIARFVVWSFIVRFWRRVSWPLRRMLLHRLLAILTLLSYLFLYTPLKRNYSSVHFDRRDSGCHAAADRLGSRSRTPRCQCLAAVRNCISLAVPTFHGHCVDVSRRLCACRLSRLARGQVQRSLCCLAIPTSRFGTFRSGPRSCNSRSVRNCLSCRRSCSWRRLSPATAHALPFECLPFLHGSCFLLPSFIYRRCLLCSELDKK